MYSQNTLNPLANNYNPYASLYTRPRLSSTCETETESSAESSGASSVSSTSASNPYHDTRELALDARNSPIDNTSDIGDLREEDEHEHENLEDKREIIQGHVTNQEKNAIEKFFSGLKTQVYVCQSLANLYTKSNNSEEDWELCFTGIPVVLLDMGECKSRTKRKIQIILAERGSSFMLWRDTIDNLTSYKVSGKAFHTMCLSSDHRTLIGISFDVASAAEEMYSHIEKLVSCPENISLNAPGKKKKKHEKYVKPLPLPPKSHISQPCCFQHVTSVDLEDRPKYVSLQRFLSAINAKTPQDF